MMNRKKTREVLRGILENNSVVNQVVNVSVDTAAFHYYDPINKIKIVKKFEKGNFTEKLIAEHAYNETLRELKLKGTTCRRSGIDIGLNSGGDGAILKLTGIR